MTTQRPCIDEIGVARCTGCGGCDSACTRGAIELSLDGDGFYKPLVNRERCDGCGQCARRCPVIPREDAAGLHGRWPQPRAFAAWANDEPTRLASSSGGIFSELARPVIGAGGAVVGCVWGDRWIPEHVVARTWTDVERMRGSKYVPSHIGTAYRQVLAGLRDGAAPVLFSGTPCQVAAMERALGARQRDRVLLVEFFCHGVPSLRAFHAYLEDLFQGDEVAKYTFRDKTLGWQTVLAEAVDGRRYRNVMSSDAFGRGFALENLYLMEACYDCSFARLPRRGDITIGDYWGCPDEWHDKRGVSVALANTPAGLRALEATGSSGRISLRPTELASATARNRCGASAAYPVPRHRRAFLDGLATGVSFGQLTSRYFGGKWYWRWRSFRQSESKMRFVLEVARGGVRRMLGHRRESSIPG
jgi:coenzyme F420-reducing hydrogenase beta subunit